MNDDMSSQPLLTPANVIRKYIELRRKVDAIDLSAANTIVWYGPTDRVEDYQQANQRIAGPRQRRGMLIVRLASTSIERTIYQRLDNKQSLQGIILDLVKEGSAP
jgi:hypothetical protein